MTKTVNVYEAKTQLSSLIRDAANGKEIIIAKAGVPMARLVAYQRTREARRPGGAAGQVVIGPDFDAPLPAEAIESFLGHG